MTPLWVHRPLVNWQDVFRWAIEAGIKKLMPASELHVTLATVREPVDWEGLELLTDTLVVPAGLKTVQIFGFTSKALSFGHPDIKARHEELVNRFPQMDHPILRPHVTLFRGGKMPHLPYEGALIFGPEVASEFNEQKARDIKHIKINSPQMRQELGLLDDVA